MFAQVNVFAEMDRRGGAGTLNYNRLHFKLNSFSVTIVILGLFFAYIHLLLLGLSTDTTGRR